MLLCMSLYYTGSEGFINIFKDFSLKYWTEKYVPLSPSLNLNHVAHLSYSDTLDNRSLDYNEGDKSCHFDTANIYSCVESRIVKRALLF